MDFGTMRLEMDHHSNQRKVYSKNALSIHKIFTTEDLNLNNDHVLILKYMLKSIDIHFVLFCFRKRKVVITVFFNILIRLGLGRQRGGL